MNRVVFRPNIVITFIIFIAMVILSVFLYVKLDFPMITIPIIVLLAFLIFIPAVRNKIIIEDGVLRYEKIGRTEFADLKRVSQIVKKEEITYVDKPTGLRDDDEY